MRRPHSARVLYRFQSPKGRAISATAFGGLLVVRQSRLPVKPSTGIGSTEKNPIVALSDDAKVCPLRMEG